MIECSLAEIKEMIDVSIELYQSEGDSLQVAIAKTRHEMKLWVTYHPAQAKAFYAIFDEKESSE